LRLAQRLRTPGGGISGRSPEMPYRTGTLPLARKIAVRFDANVAAGLPWKFEPEQTEIEVRIGEVVTVTGHK